MEEGTGAGRSVIVLTVTTEKKGYLVDESVDIYQAFSRLRDFDSALLIEVSQYLDNPQALNLRLLEHFYDIDDYLHPFLPLHI